MMLRLREASGYTVALYVARGFVLLKGLLLARMLGPTQYGTVAAFSTFLAYASYLDIGVFHAQNREIPMLTGAGRSDEAGHVARVSLGVAVGVALIAGVALEGAAALQAAGILQGTWWFSAGLGAAVIAQQVTGYFHSLSFAKKEFTAQARGMIALTVVDAGVSLGLGAIFGAPGVLLGAWVAPVVQGAVLVGRRTLRVAPLRDAAVAWALVKTGVPIGLMWFANTNMVGVDKLVALYGVGVTQLGVYSLASVAGGLVTLGPTAVAGLLGPRILERYGADGEHSGRGARLASTGQLACAAAGGVVVAGTLAALPKLTGTFLPAYKAGIPAAFALAAASVVLGATFPINSLAVAVRAQNFVAAVYLADAAFNVVLDIVLLRAGMGILGIAVGSLVSYTVLLVVLTAWASRRSGGEVAPGFGLGWSMIAGGLVTGAVAAWATQGSASTILSCAAAVLASGAVGAVVVPVVAGRLRRTMGEDVST